MLDMYGTCITLISIVIQENWKTQKAASILPASIFILLYKNHEPKVSPRTTIRIAIIIKRNFEEPNNLLKQEVREPAIYNAVIAAIASGCSKMKEISNKVGEDTSVCSIYIKNLITLGIVKKESPYGEKSSRKTIYSIKDNMFRFWYRFVPEITSLISRGAADLVYKRIAPEFSSYMGDVFEEICKQ